MSGLFLISGVEWFKKSSSIKIIANLIITFPQLLRFVFFENSNDNVKPINGNTRMLISILKSSIEMNLS